MSYQTEVIEVVEMLWKEAVNFYCPDYNSGCSDYIERVKLALRQMDWDTALDLCRQDVALRQAVCPEANIDAEYCRAIAQMYLGAVYHAMGDLEEAENRYRQSAAIFSIIDRNDSRWSEAVARYAVGLLAQSRGDLYQAHRLYHQSLLLFQRFGQRTANVRLAEHRVRERIRLVDFLRRQSQEAQERTDFIPIIGTTAAGEPILAIEVGPEDVSSHKISLRDRDCKIKRLLEASKGDTLELKPGGTYFALRVEGDSMREVGIENGDYVLFIQQPAADPGEIVVVRIIDAAYGYSLTVKTFHRQGKTILLKAENPEYQPQVQVFRASDPTIEILGKAVAVVSPFDERI